MTDRSTRSAQRPCGISSTFRTSFRHLRTSLCSIAIIARRKRFLLPPTAASASPRSVLPRTSGLSGSFQSRSTSRTGRSPCLEWPLCAISCPWWARNPNFRITPESKLNSEIAACPKSAIKRHHESLRSKTDIKCCLSLSPVCACRPKPDISPPTRPVSSEELPLPATRPRLAAPAPQGRPIIFPSTP